MPNNSYATRLSGAISWLRFPLIVFIILLHCYSVAALPGQHNLYFSLIYPLSLWLGETGVPAFFFISGYLFFLSRKSYAEKLKTRLHTLLLPYLLWNMLLLALYLAAYALGHPQDIYGRNMADYGFTDYLRLFWDRGHFDLGNFVPLLCPLWYIRNLLIMAILSPLLYPVIKRAGIPFLTAIGIWWLLTYHNAFVQQTLLFFGLGAYFSIHGINPLEAACKRKPLLLALCAAFAIGDIVSHTILPTPVNLQLHRLSLLFNIPALLLLADACLRHGITCKSLPDKAFIVFCVHYPLVVPLRKLIISHFGHVSDAAHILLYLLSAVIVTLLSLAFCTALERWLPAIKKLLSGNR